MCEPQTPERRNDLWIVHKAFDYGVEENFELWRRAELFVEGLCVMTQNWDAHLSIRNEALMVALMDCHDRCREEAKRHKAELEMRQ